MACPLHFLSYLDGLCVFYRLAATCPQMEDTPTPTMMTYPGRSAPLPPHSLGWLHPRARCVSKEGPGLSEQRRDHIQGVGLSQIKGKPAPHWQPQAFL